MYVAIAALCGEAGDSSNLTNAGILLTLLGAIGTAALGYMIAMLTLRGERSFDRRLAWYEEMVRILLDFSFNLHVAATVTSQGSSLDDIKECWDLVYEGEREFDIHVSKGSIYADARTLDALRSALNQVQEQSRERGGFNYVVAKERPFPPIHELAESLRSAAEPVALAARRQLGVNFFSRYR